MLVTATQLLTKSIDLYKKHLGRYVTYSAILAIPTILISIASASIGMLILVTQNFLTGFSIFIIFAIIMSLIGFVISLALIRAIADDYTEMVAQPIISTMRQSIHLLIPAILISILTTLVVFGGIILLIIPGIIFALWFTFSVHALVIDKKHSIDALKYSKSLVSGHWFSILWRLFAPFILITIAIMIVQWIFAMILGIQTDSQFQFTITQTIYLILSTIINILITPITVAIPTILYIELKKTSIQQPITQKIDHVSAE